MKFLPPTENTTLNRAFYNELLYIIGLEESRTEKNTKTVITRRKQSEEGSFIEMIIDKLSSKINNQKKCFEVALDLTITWITRILFLKLLEGQIVEFYDYENEYKFLTKVKIIKFRDLQDLFFSVLNTKPSNRFPESIKRKYNHIPFLNESLFEQTDAEKKYLQITLLEKRNLPFFDSTILKDLKKSRKDRKIFNLDYLLEFLESYEFSTKKIKGVVDNHKTIITPAILGLIFEKVNGYKDGAFFTPEIITQYMADQAIEDIVISKFNTQYTWNCKTINELKEKITNFKEANEIINAIKICDPAVGSGHFLVSALNTILEIKSILGIILESSGELLKNVNVDIVNGQLLIYDSSNKIFAFKSLDDQRNYIQKILFFEKKKIIENCLFGVDINNKSVSICRFRLWMELLRNAYYDEDSVGFLNFHGLPNLKSNIRCGNSLIGNINLKLEKNDSFINSFIWSLEFPQLHTSESGFLGFDLIIGNPPYAYTRDIKKEEIDFLKKSYNSYLNDFYEFFVYRSIDLVRENGIVTLITPNTYFTLNSKTKFRQQILNLINLKFTYSGYCFEDAYVETMIFKGTKVLDQEKVLDNTICFVKDPKDYKKFETLKGDKNIFLNNIYARIFYPTVFNLWIHEQINVPSQKYWQDYNDKFFQKNGNNNQIAIGINDIIYLGLVSDGEQGLVTGNNSKYLGKIVSTIEERNKIENEFLIKLRNLSCEVSEEEFRTDKEKYYDVAEQLKDKYKKPALFGKSFLYKCIHKLDVAIYGELSLSQKEKGDKNNLWLIYNRGNKEGDRWLVSSTECINWNEKYIKELHEGKLTNSRWQGFQYFDNTGFAWVDYFTDKMKAFYVEAGPYSKNTVKLHSINDLISDKYILALLNSSFISYYVKNFITGTHTLQINDGRLIPVKIPTPDVKNVLENLVDQILERLTASSTAIVTDLELQVNTIVNKLYEIDNFV